MVELEGVSKVFGSVLALAEVDLVIETAEFMTLLGPSGSGKTTLLNIIAGMVSPTRGRVYLDGKDATSTPSNLRGLGMVFQNYALMPHMTIFENIAFPLRVRKMRKREMEKKVTEVLDLVQLPGVEKRKPRELSGGQQQRVALARAIVYNPAIILFDEPLGALDKRLRDDMQLQLKRLHKDLGITMLYVTHDQEEALTMSDRIVLLRSGYIEQIDTPQGLYFNPKSAFAAEFLGDSNLMDVQVQAVGETTNVIYDGEWAFKARRSPLAQVGENVKTLIRPENVRVLRQPDPTLSNQVQVTVIDSIILGGVVKHYTRLPDGSTFIAQELNRVAQTALASGSRVDLGWRPDDMLVLPPEDAATGGRGSR